MEKKIRKRKYSECSNCSTRLESSHAYCPQCGQANHDLIIPLKHLLEEAVEGILHFDVKSVRTIQALAFKPGFVTSEFIKGKRVSFVAPVRMYIFISFLFFLLMSVLPGSHAVTSSEESQSKPIAITFYGINSHGLRGLQPVQLDSVLQSSGIERTILNRYIVRQMSRIDMEGEEGFKHLLVKGISYMMFALMPLFAAIVFLLNRKKAQYYIGTLIFSIHFHSFVFLLLTAVLVLDRIIGTSLIFVVPLIICPIYLYLALRNMYEGSRKRMIGETLLIGVLQIVSMVLLLIPTMLISLLIY